MFHNGSVIFHSDPVNQVSSTHIHNQPIEKKKKRATFSHCLVMVYQVFLFTVIYLYLTELDNLHSEITCGILLLLWN